MEPSKAHEIKEGAKTANMQWILWVDDEIWGYVNTLDNAKKSRDDLSIEIKKVIQEQHPHWIIECVNCEDNERVVKIKCTDPGWVYNSKWTAHTVRYEAICKFNLLVEPITHLSSSIATIQQREWDSYLDMTPKDIPVPPPPPKVINTRNGRKQNRRNRRRNY